MKLIKDVGYHRNRLVQRVLGAETEPLLTDFGVFHSLDSCEAHKKMHSIMHWLHVNPNSDYSTFWHFFGTFLKNFGQFSAVIWQIFCQKILETLVFVIFSADNLHLADFQQFFWSFGKYFEHRWTRSKI